jgi:hypothetical protein
VAGWLLLAALRAVLQRDREASRGEERREQGSWKEVGLVRAVKRGEPKISLLSSISFSFFLLLQNAVDFDTS